MKHLKKFNELYDSEESKKNISKDELRKMVSMDYEHSYEPGKWVGKNSADLQIGVSDYKKGNSNTMFNRYGILDILSDKVYKLIPSISEFKMVNDDIDSINRFSFNREVILNAPNLKDDYSIKMNLYISYNFKGDDVMGYEENSIKILFTPLITTSRTSVDLGGIGKFGKDISDDEATRVIFKLDNLLYGSPDKEDASIRKEFKVSGDNLSISEFEDKLIEVKDSLNKFGNYVYGKYGIKVIN